MFPTMSSSDRRRRGDVAGAGVDSGHLDFTVPQLLIAVERCGPAVRRHSRRGNDRPVVRSCRLWPVVHDVQAASPSPRDWCRSPRSTALKRRACIRSSWRPDGHRNGVRPPFVVLRDVIVHGRNVSNRSMPAVAGEFLLQSVPVSRREQPERPVVVVTPADDRPPTDRMVVNHTAASQDDCRPCRPGQRT